MENIVFACKTCNSSKADRDMFGWYVEHFDTFPSIYLTATYLKKIYLFAQANDLLNIELSVLDTMDLPFDWKYIPTKYPEPKYFQQE